MPFVTHTRRVYAHRRKVRRKILHYLLFIVAIALTALILRFIFSLEKYVPRFYEPKDTEREQHLKKQQK